MSFIFGGNTGIKSPQELKERRELSRALMARGMSQQPKDLWSGLNHLAGAIGNRVERGRLDEAEASGRASADEAFAPLKAALANKQTPDAGMLTGALSNEWLNPGQRSLAEALYKQQLETSQPLTEWQKAQLAENDQITPYQQAQIDIDKQRIAQTGSASKYGLNPIWGKDANGNTVLFQLPQAGGQPVQVPFPEGVVPTPGYSYQDIGTGFVPHNVKTGVPGAVVPKDIKGKEIAEEVGAAEGKAIAAAPGDYQAGQNAIDLVDQIRNDPYKGRGTGFSSLGNMIPGTGGYDFQNKVNQAKSGAFLTSIQQMRGLGQLSNAEGQTATAAVNRMNTATSEEEFDAALNDYEKIIRLGMARAAKRGGAPKAEPDGSQNAFGNDPQFGQEVNGYKIGQTAKNPQTGETIVWDGNGWRPQ